MSTTGVDRPNVRDIERINVLVHEGTAFSFYTAKSFIVTDVEHCVRVIDDFMAKVEGHSSAPHFSVRGDAGLVRETAKRIIEVLYVVPYGRDKAWSGLVSEDGTPVIHLEMPAVDDHVNNAQPAQTARSSSSIKQRNRKVGQVCLFICNCFRFTRRGQFLLRMVVA